MEPTSTYNFAIFDEKCIRITLFENSQKLTQIELGIL